MRSVMLSSFFCSTPRPVFASLIRCSMRPCTPAPAHVSQSGRGEGGDGKEGVREGEGGTW